MKPGHVRACVRERALPPSRGPVVVACLLHLVSTTAGRGYPSPQGRGFVLFERSPHIQLLAATARLREDRDQDEAPILSVHTARRSGWAHLRIGVGSWSSPQPSWIGCWWVCIFSCIFETGKFLLANQMEGPSRCHCIWEAVVEDPLECKERSVFLLR